MHLLHAEPAIDMLCNFSPMTNSRCREINERDSMCVLPHVGQPRRTRFRSHIATHILQGSARISGGQIASLIAIEAVKYHLWCINRYYCLRYSPLQGGDNILLSNKFGAFELWYRTSINLCAFLPHVLKLYSDPFTPPRFVPNFCLAWGQNPGKDRHVLINGISLAVWRLADRD